MAALTKNNSTFERMVSSRTRDFPVGALASVYQGGFVGMDPGGYAKAFEAGDSLIGVAFSSATGSSTAGAITVAVDTTGDIVTGLTATVVNIGSPVYAVTDNPADCAFMGHYDGFVGHVVGLESVNGTNKAVVRLKTPGERPCGMIGTVELVERGEGEREGLATTTGQKYWPSGYTAKSILGAGVHSINADSGGIEFAFDAVAEVALASLRTTNSIFPVDMGITLEADFSVANNGSTSAVDIDIGLGSALTVNSEADIDHADMEQLVAVHLNSNDLNIYAQSDDATTDVAATDTARDHEVGAYTKIKIIVRPSGVCEFWVGGARVLSSVSFGVLSTTNLAAFCNVEKTSDITAFSLYLRNFRLAGAKSVAA